MTSGSVTQMTQSKIPSSPVQASNHFIHGRVSSVQNPSSFIAPSNNLLSNYGYNIHGWATVERSRFEYHGVAKNGNRNQDVLGEQSPRRSRPRDQWTSLSNGTHITNTGASNVQGAIVIWADQFNKDDFPLDYPDAMFFVIESYSEDDVHKSIKYNVWPSTPNDNRD